MKRTSVCQPVVDWYHLNVYSLQLQTSFIQLSGLAVCLSIRFRLAKKEEIMRFGIVLLYSGH